MNDNIISFNTNSFKNCKKLVKINFPENLKIIGVTSFEGCKSLRKIVLSNNIHSIYERAFLDCINLEYIELSEKLNIVCKEAFKNCKHLGRIIFKKVCKELGENIFDGTENEFVVEFNGTLEQWKELTKTRKVCVSHQTLNDFHYYGDAVDDYVKDIYEDEVIIAYNVKYKLICNEQ